MVGLSGATMFTGVLVTGCAVAFTRVLMGECATEDFVSPEVADFEARCWVATLFTGVTGMSTGDGTEIFSGLSGALVVVFDANGPGV